MQVSWMTKKTTTNNNSVTVKVFPEILDVLCILNGFFLSVSAYRDSCHLQGSEMNWPVFGGYDRKISPNTDSC